MMNHVSPPRPWTYRDVLIELRLCLAVSAIGPVLKLCPTDREGCDVSSSTSIH